MTMQLSDGMMDRAKAIVTHLYANPYDTIRRIADSIGLTPSELRPVIRMAKAQAMLRSSRGRGSRLEPTHWGLFQAGLPPVPIFHN